VDLPTESATAPAAAPSGPDVCPSGAPLVGVIMGSDSDLATMSAAADVLSQFGVSAEVTVVSAHRTPDRMLDYARGAAARGMKAMHFNLLVYLNFFARARKAVGSHSGRKGNAFQSPHFF
jgi:AIR carboxylase